MPLLVEFLHLYSLATSLCAFDVWTIFPLKMGASTTLSQKKKKKKKNMVLVHRQLLWLYGKDGCWHDFNAYASVDVASCQGQVLTHLRDKDKY